MYNWNPVHRLILMCPITNTIIIISNLNCFNISSNSTPTMFYIVVSGIHLFSGPVYLTFHRSRFCVLLSVSIYALSFLEQNEVWILYQDARVMNIAKYITFFVSRNHAENSKKVILNHYTIIVIKYATTTNLSYQDIRSTQQLLMIGACGDSKRFHLSTTLISIVVLKCNILITLE